MIHIWLIVSVPVLSKIPTQQKTFNICKVLKICCKKGKPESNTNKRPLPNQNHLIDILVHYKFTNENLYTDVMIQNTKRLLKFATMYIISVL